MSLRRHASKLSWSLFDQCIVSGGNFVVNVLLAREMPAASYGLFALLIGIMLLLQVITATLLFHPMSVRLPLVASTDRNRLVCASMLLVLVMAIAQATIIALALSILDRLDLLVAAVCCFLTWQLHEGLRRCMLSMLWHRGATVGDAVSYIGQALLVFGLARSGNLTLEFVLFSMAATSLAGAGVQATRLGLRRARQMGLRRTAADYWSIGGFWSLGAGFLLQGRIQVLVWILAAQGGAVAVAGYQAIMNVINLSNPLMLSIHNIVPQVTAQNRDRGGSAAWRIARGYALLAVPPLGFYAALVFAAPDTVLGVFYGSASPYVGLGLPLQVVLAGALIGYAIDVVVSYLHGMTEVRSAFAINVVGSVVTVLVAVPLIARYGLVGLCVVTIVAAIARAITAQIAMRRLLAPPPQPAA